MAEPSIEIIVRGVLINHDRLLVCQNRKHGHMFLPGGHVDFNEPAAVALKREVREELGVDLEVGRCLGVCEAAFDQLRKGGGGTKRHHELNLLFLLTLPMKGADTTQSVDLVSQEEHIRFVWLPINDITQGHTRLLPEGIGRLITTSLKPESSGSDGRHWLSLFP